jgi:NitT/TauT family transport system permease protein
VSRTGALAAEWVPAVLVFVVGIAFWELAVRAFDVQNFLLPAPSDILGTLWTDRGELWSAAFFTFREAVAGFVVGSSLGFLAAVVVARFRLVRAAVMPYAIAASAVPIIAFAPITNNWFGVTGMTSKIVIAAILCFFPVMVNTMRGLTSVSPSAIELMRSYAASDRTIFRRVRLPSALPFVFSGLKVATVLAMIGAIVGDYFGGAPGALGVEIRRWVGIFAFDQAWAGIVLASALGIVFYGSVAVVERLTMGWHPSMRGGAHH